ncbi:MAG: radical SAM protein [Nanoarchaeota archaeon]
MEILQTTAFNQKMLIENLKVGLKVMGSRLFNKKVSLFVTFLTTNQCNRKCVYCNIDKNKKSKMMDTNQVINMIKQFRSKGMQQINFTGGEPLLRADIGKIISFSRKIGVKTILTTNGDLIKKNIGKLKDVNFTYLCLNGNEKVHDELRGKDSYNNTMDAINILHKRGMSIAINMILTKKNLDQIDFVYKKAREYEARIYFTPVYNFKPANITKKQLNQIKPANREIKKAFKFIEKLKKEGGHVLNSKKYIDNIINKGYHSYYFRNCLMGKLAFTIKPNGNISPCYKFVDERGLKNVIVLGVDKALISTKERDCHNCNYNCHIEQNLLLKFEPSAIINLLENYQIFEK